MPQDNKAPIPGGFDLIYDAVPQCAFLDTVNTHNGHTSIRSEADIVGYSGGGRELDCPQPFDCHPGQHVVFRCWIKTGRSIPPSGWPNSELDDRLGGRIGIDWRVHAPGPRIADGEPSDARDDYRIVTVPFNRDWTFVVWDLPVPTKAYSLDVNGDPFPDGGTHYVDSLHAWLDVRPLKDQGKVWFADAEFYVLDAGESAPPPISPPVEPPPVENFILDVWTADGGTTTPTGRKSYASGTQVQINANANPGYVFSGYLVNNSPRSENPLTLIMTQDATVIPIFNLVPTPPETPSQAGATIPFLLVLGGTSACGLLYILTRGKKRTRRRRK
jgi:hypothetical protein